MQRIIYIAIIVVALLLSVALVLPAGAAPNRADRGPWAANTAYAVNDTVTYAGCSYKVLQAHTSLTGWEPPTTPALFQQLSCGSVPTNTATRTNTPGTGATATRTATRTNTPISGSLPDLVITSITYVGSTPACANSPRDNVVVSNNGTAAAGSFTVSFGPSYTQTVSSLAAGSSVTLSFGAIMGTATATADSTGVVAESNESNNSMTASLPAPTQAPTCTPTGGPSATRTRTPTPAVITNTPTRTATRTNTPTATTASGGTCSGVPQYVAGTAYTAGQLVQNVGNKYSCTIAGWCSSTAAWAYAPGTGTYWTDAWALVGPCGPTGPTLTPTRTNTPCGNCGGSLPKHVITGYWQNFNNGAMVLRLSSVPTSYNLIAVAFADASGSAGAVTFNVDSGLSSALGGYTNANFTSDVATVHSRGQKVIISVGGQNGTVSVASSSAATNFANSIIGLMNTYGFDGVDIDLENGINATYMAQALRSVVASKPGAIITFAPQTIDFQSTGAGYYQLAISIKDILTINNMQYYNSGSMLGCNGQVYSQGGVDFITSQACIQLQAGLRPDQIGLGLPASTSGAGSGYVSPSVVNAALDCLAAGTNCGAYHPASPWPGIRGAMTWSINWDASNGYAWVNAISAHLGSVP